MKTKSVGTKIRTAREKKKLTREQLAKRLDISPGYLGHLEYDNWVRLSERVKLALEKILRIRLTAKEVARHNARTARYFAKYSKKSA